jgi:large subunit ribosomal protein L21
MDFAVALVNGKQEHVVLGQTIVVDRLSNKVGESLVFDRVLLLQQDGKILVGTPFIKDISVEGLVLDHISGDKIHVYKYKQKVRYRRKTGFRAKLTQIKIVKIGDKKAENNKPESAKTEVNSKEVQKITKQPKMVVKKAKTATK